MPSKKQAIHNLTQQITKLDDFDYIKKETWQPQTAEYIKQYFGEESNQYKFITAFNFTAQGTNLSPDDQKKLKAEKAKLFLQEAIEFLQNHGLYKKPKKNFLEGLNNAFLSGIILLGVNALFWGGWLIGDNKDYAEKDKLHQTVANKDSIIKQQNELILSLRRSLSRQVTKTPSTDSIK